MKNKVINLLIGVISCYPEQVYKESTYTMWKFYRYKMSAHHPDLPAEEISMMYKVMGEYKNKFFHGHTADGMINRFRSIMEYTHTYKSINGSVNRCYIESKISKTHTWFARNVINESGASVTVGWFGLKKIK